MIRTSLIAVLLLSNITACYAVVNYRVEINKTGEDYGLISTAEAALDDVGDIRAASNLAKCGNWDNQVGGNIADATAVTWDVGARSGTLIHQTTTQYLIKCTTTTDCTNLGDNDTVTDGTNSFDIAGAPDSCIVEIDLYDDNGLIDDTFTIDGFTSDTTNYVLVTAPVGERHSGTKASGAGISNTTASSVITLSDVGAVVSWLRVTSNFNNASNFRIAATNENNTSIQNCVLYDSNNSGAGTIAGIAMNPGGASMDSSAYNNIVEDMEDDCFSINGGGAGNDYILYNNTAYSCGALGFDHSFTTGNTVLINNLAIGNATDYDSTWDTFTTNGSGDTTGSVGLQSLSAATEFTNIGVGTEDLHLKTGATSIDTGTDNGPGVFSFDIDNRDRDALGDTWDLGADEFVTEIRRRRGQLVGI